MIILGELMIILSSLMINPLLLMTLYPALGVLKKIRLMIILGELMIIRSSLMINRLLLMVIRLLEIQKTSDSDYPLRFSEYLSRLSEFPNNPGIFRISGSWKSKNPRIPKNLRDLKIPRSNLNSASLH